MTRPALATALLFIVCAAMPAGAECPTAGTRAVVLKSVADGDTFLAADGAEVDLDGVLAPGSDGETVTPDRAAAARTALAAALRKGALTLAFAGPEKDRYGRLPAQVFAGGEWVQGALLRSGLARAAPEIAGDACASALLAAEAEARAAKRGGWGDGSFAVLAPEEAVARAKTIAGTFQIVEGPVRSVATQRSRTYLNFGADWHNDFTVAIAPEDMKSFRSAKVNIKALERKRVRVRGWIELYYGPEIELARPGMLENLEPGAPPKQKPRKRKQPGREPPGLPGSSQ